MTTAASLLLGVAGLACWGIALGIPAAPRPTPGSPAPDPGPLLFAFAACGTVLAALCVGPPPGLQRRAPAHDQLTTS